MFHPQITLPAPKPGVRKGCAAVLAAAGGAEQQHAPAVASDSDQEPDSMDEDGEPGACAICYALHLPDPARLDELGKFAGWPSAKKLTADCLSSVCRWVRGVSTYIRSCMPCVHLQLCQLEHDISRVSARLAHVCPACRCRCCPKRVLPCRVLWQGVSCSMPGRVARRHPQQQARV